MVLEIAHGLALTRRNEKSPCAELTHRTFSAAAFLNRSPGASACGMSTKRIETAAALVRFGASIRIECGSCGSARTLSGPEMVKACGAGPLRSAAVRLKCGRCGAKDARLAVLPPV